jgi:excisionase family DNA binding protein
MFQNIAEMVGTDELVTTNEFAAAARIHTKTLFKKINRGDIPFVRIGRKVLIQTKHLTPEHVTDLQVHADYITLTRAQQSVYFIQAASGPIKIGIALDPVERLAGLQISHFETLTLLAAVEGGITLETELHRRFAGHNIRGEWFEPHADIFAEIARLAAPKQHHQEGL